MERGVHVMNVNDVAIGQLVGYGYWHRNSLLCFNRSKVAKINGFGHITLDDGSVFDKHGKLRGDTNPRVYLIDIATADEYSKNMKILRDRSTAVSELKNKIAGRQRGDSYYAEFSQELKDQLKELIDAL
jgi:hypothetical protein